MGVHFSDRVILGMAGNYWQWFSLLNDVKASISSSFPCVPKLAAATSAIKHTFEAGRKGEEWFQP